MADRVGRRGAFARLLAAAAGAAGFVGAAKAEGPPGVAYHLSDLDKVAFALGNIENHIEGMGGPGAVHIVLVVNGPALAAFRLTKANPDLTRRLAALRTAGLELNACGNTMRAQKLELADLLEGFVRVDQGGVTRLGQLQHAGFAYIRP